MFDILTSTFFRQTFFVLSICKRNWFAIADWIYVYCQIRNL